MTKSKSKKSTAKAEKKDKVPEAKPQNEEVFKKHHSSDPVWALFLISIGIVFLLNNFGILPWSIWTHIWRFWPLFLILGGIKMVFGKNIVSTILVTILGVFIIGLVMLYIAIPSIPQFDNWLEREMPELHKGARRVMEITSQNVEEKTITVSEGDYEDVEERNITMELGARTITIEESEDGNLFKLNGNYIEGYNEPEVDEDFEDGDLNISVDMTSNTWGWGGMSNPFMKVSLGKTEIPTSLSINLGAGTLTSELETLILSKLEAEVGAGTMNLTLSEDNLSETESMALEVGTGTINVTLPDSKTIGFRFTYDVGVGTLNIGSENLRGDGTYESDNYDTADTQLEISIDVGVGTVDIDFE